MNGTKVLITGSLLILFSSFPSLAGTKEEIIRLQSDILQLQDQVRILQKHMDDNGEVIKSLLEQLNDRIAETSVQMTQLASALQSQKADAGTTLAQLRQEIQSLSIKWDDTNNRIAALQQGVRENQVRVQSLRQVPSGEDGASMEPDQIYSSVYNDYLMGNYDLAIAGFQDFLANHSDSEYADNASYYLGVCYGEKGRFEQAIQAFDQVINLYPKADKTPPAYYKKALVLAHLQRNTDAIETFKRLIAIFPDSQEAQLSRQELEKLGVQASRR